MTCEVTCAGGAKWYATKESGQLPELCSGMQGLLENMENMLKPRAKRSVFVVKMLGGPGQYEVLVVPLIPSTVDWFEREILPTVVHHVQSSKWVGVEHIREFLQCKSPCLQACKGLCSCGEASLWRQGGFRSVRGPELHYPYLPFWWAGVCDGVGDVGTGMPWMHCPCSTCVV